MSQCVEELGQSLKSPKGDMINLFMRFCYSPHSLYWYFSTRLTHPSHLNGKL